MDPTVPGPTGRPCHPQRSSVGISIPSSFTSAAPQPRWCTIAGSRNRAAGAAAWAAAATACATQLALARRWPHGTKGAIAARYRGKRAITRLAAQAEAEVVAGFVSACSMADTFEQAVEEVGEATGSGFEAGMAFITESHLIQTQGLKKALETLRQRLGVQYLVGCACPGAIGQAVGPSAVDYSGGLAGEDWPPIEIERGPAVSVGLLRTAGATPFFLGSDNSDTDLLNRRAGDKDVRSILLISDPFAPAEQSLKTLDELFPQAVKAGGISSALQVGTADRMAYESSIAIAAEGCPVRLCNQGLVGLLLTKVDVHTIVCQGCLGVGPAVKISQVQGPVCTGIGGHPASEAIRLIFSAVDPPTREKMKEFLTVGIGSVGQSETQVGDGDWLIRGISGVTPDGGLVIGDSIEEGQPMRFHVRDRESAETDLALMLKRYRLERTFSDYGEAAGCLLFTCNGRGENLYGRRHVDARALADAIGSAAGARVAGLFCNGEVGSPGLAVPNTPDGGPAARGAVVHGFTAVFAVIVPRP